MEWSLNPLVAIGIGLAVMFFGYFFGLFEGRNQGYKNRQKEEAQEGVHQPEPIPSAAPPIPSDEIPVLNVSLDSTGTLRLRMDGQGVDTSAMDAEQRKRLIAILTQMRPWLNAPKAPPPPAAPTPASPTTSTTAAMPKPASAPVKSTPVSQPAPSVPANDDGDEDLAKPQSIVAQIDSVLQARLASTPLADKGIRLQESLDGGVLVWVGLEKFEGVEKVSDETIKAAIKGAITEWENKYTPGL